MGRVVALFRMWPWLAAFGIFGMLYGFWPVLLAEISADLRLSPGPLGFALSLGFVAALPAMVAAGRAVDRWGRRAVVLGAGGAMAATWVGFSAVQGFAPLVAALACFSAASGVYDVGINAAAMAAEQRGGRRLLPLCHGTFSGGGAVGALSAGALVSGGVPFRALYLAVAVLIVGAMLLVARSEIAGGTGEPPLRRGPGRDRWGLFWRRALLLMAAMTALGFLFEGAMETWSVVYLRRSLELPALLGASGAAVFHGAMLIGRLGTAGAVARVGRRATLRGGGLLAAAGLGVALATERAPVILLGLLIVGLCLSAVAPVTFSLAADLAPGRTGEASSVITTLGYGGFLIGPTVIGGLGEAIGLRGALATLIAVGVAIALLAGRVGTLAVDPTEAIEPARDRAPAEVG